MISALAAISGFIFIQLFAPNIEILQVGYILCGIAWEVYPIALREYRTTYVNLCWVIGQTMASGILRCMLSVENEWAYRTCYAIQWVWPIPIIIGVFLAPESPWWLIRRGRTEAAVKAIGRRTTKADANFSSEQKVAMMIHTNEMERRASEGTLYWDCFKGTDLRRTEIAAVVWLMQVFCGSALMMYSTYFYEQAGLPTTQSFTFTLIQYGLGAVGTGSTWVSMTYRGRRTLYFGGMFCYSLVAEIPSTTLRSKSIVITRNAYNIEFIVNNVVTPCSTPAHGTGKAKLDFFGLGLMVSRKFRTTAVDPFNGMKSQLDEDKSTETLVEKVN
ncbi:hypothetical protein V1525DRAFT_451265 [Lipomyces kononenkoae]|uniref:Uncharacterized protein n=1 Tax=Lipomyces kononenkoae TaxID=34357 RepID=A0ACC3SZ60_LIPKO